VAVAISLLAAVPVLAWNAQHDWITLTHLEERGNLNTAWHPTLDHLAGFAVAEAALLNPIFLVAAVWAALAFWRRHRQDALMVFCFSMGAPLVLFYLLFSLRSPVQGNWIAPSVVPLFTLLVLYGQARWLEGKRAVQRWLAAGLALGLVAVVVLHDTELINTATGLRLPRQYDPMRRVQGWRATANRVEAARINLETPGQPAFVIADHYGLTSLLTFYLPGPKRAVASEPRVFCRTGSRPRNQFFFWRGYGDRRGQNAIYVQRADEPRPPPPDLVEQFASVKDLGVQSVLRRGRVLHSFQLFECRQLR
jgi:hypothetical protein